MGYLHHLETPLKLNHECMIFNEVNRANVINFFHLFLLSYFLLFLLEICILLTFLLGNTINFMSSYYENVAFLLILSKAYISFIHFISFFGIYCFSPFICLFHSFSLSSSHSIFSFACVVINSVFVSCFFPSVILIL